MQSLFGGQDATAGGSVDGLVVVETGEEGGDYIARSPEAGVASGNPALFRLLRGREGLPQWLIGDRAAHRHDIAVLRAISAFLVAQRHDRSFAVRAHCINLICSCHEKSLR